MQKCEHPQLHRLLFCTFIMLGLSHNGGSKKENRAKGTFLLCILHLTYCEFHQIKKEVIGASCSPHHKTQEVCIAFHK